MIAGLVGHYRVVSTVGQGGMGVVYKAIDTHLNRPVALKTLSTERDIPAEAVARLKAEALAAASLDHPYICKIYELLDAGADTVIVMEYVEGETLAGRLSRGTPDLGDTLKYGAEIAEGLAAAHAHGLVHRDVKPSNVMVTPHGHVKLLDFGIVREDLLSSSADTHPALTGPGVAVGTPFYMAPEQALAMPVDARADIFSLGVVLFECMTGQLPFEGSTRAAYMQEMLSGRVRSLDALAPSVPARVRRLVERCLEHDPRRRPESASAIAADLRSAAELLHSGPSPVKTLTTWRTWISRGVTALLVIGAGAGAGVAWRSAWQSTPPPAIVFQPVVTEPGTNTDPRVAPDGRWFSFISDRQGVARLFVQAIDAGTPQVIDVPADAVMSHTWSPDGTSIACAAWQNGALVLLVVPAFFGGVPTMRIVLNPRPVDVRLSRWTLSGIFATVDLGVDGVRLWRVAIDGSTVDLTKHWATGLDYLGFDVDEIGTQVVIAAHEYGQNDLWIAGVDGSGLRRLTTDTAVERHPVWTGRRTVAFQSTASGQLDVWEKDVSTGSVRPLTSSQTAEIPGGSTSDGSILLYEQVGVQATLWRQADFARPVQLTSDALSDFSPSLNADGRQVAFQRTRPKYREGFSILDSQIFVAGLLDAQPLAAQSLVADGFCPRLSPDGTWLSYLTRAPETSRFAIHVRSLQTGQQQIVTNAAPLVAMSSGMPLDWSEQRFAWAGKRLVFVEAQQGGDRIAIFDPSRAAAAETLVAAAGLEVQDLRVSPDGRQIGYLRWADGGFQLRLRDLETGDDVLLLKRPAGSRVLRLRGWTAGGSLILLTVQPNLNGVDRLTVEQATQAGGSDQLAVIDNAFAATARVNRSGTRILLTRTERAVHNIFEVVLASGRVRQLTDNQQRGVSFAGIESLLSGDIVYSRAEWRRDIWLGRRTR